MAMKQFDQKILACALYELFMISVLLGNIGESNLTRGFLGVNRPYPRLKHRIAGGNITSLKRVPFNVQFFNKGAMCGGTILSKKIVLTAAHCFDFNIDVKEMKILSRSRFIYDKHSKSHNVWRFKFHEQYNHTHKFENDIAIIMIVDKFIYQLTVQSARLCNTDVWMVENEVLMVTGWGEEKYGAGISKQVLRKTYMRYISNKKCKHLSKINLTDDMFCLYGDGVRDTCRGDSGSGVFWHGLLVGITSHGRGCVKLPSIYVNLYYMRNWIDETVKTLYLNFCKSQKKQ